MPPRHITLLLVALAAWGTVVLPERTGAAGKPGLIPREHRTPLSELAGRTSGRHIGSRRIAPLYGAPAGPLFQPLTAPFEEDFEGPAFPPAGWAILNPDSFSITWERAAGVSAFGAGQGAAWMDFYDYEFDAGDRDELRTPVVTGLTDADSLMFDYAYAEYDDPFFGPDSLVVRLSLNGGATFPVTLFAGGGATLATASPTDLPFVPQAGEWRTVRIPLAAGVTSGSVVVSFIGINGYSNNLYLDNVFLGTIPANDIAAAGVVTPAGGSKQRTTFQPAGAFRNRGTAAQSAIPVRCTITAPGGGVLYNEGTTLASLTPGASDTALFPPFAVPVVPGYYAVRFLAALPGDAVPGNDTAVSVFVRPGVLSGTITVGAGGQVPTLRAMAETLNASDVGGPLTFRLISPVYAETGPVTIRNLEGSGPAAPVRITPSPGLSVAVSVPGTQEEPWAIALRGAPWVEIDGGAGGSAPPLSIAAEGPDGAIGIFISGTEERTSSGCTVRRTALRTGADSVAGSNGTYGILVLGADETRRDTGILIRECVITRHGQAGIAAQNAQDLRIEQCRIGGWRQAGGFTDLRGIWLSTGTGAATVDRTIVDDIRNDVNGWWAVGIESGGGAGSFLLCRNSGISRIRAGGAGTDRNLAAGIWISSIFNTGDRILHTSVSLEGTDSSTFGESRSSALEIAAGATGVQVRNSILANTGRHLSGGPSSRAFALYTPAASWPVTDTSNRNVFYTPGPEGAAGYLNGAARVTLADWRSASGQDQASVAGNPRFAGSDNLRIALGSSPAADLGLPLAAVTEDIDGEPRDPAAPDAGMDEFPGNGTIVPVTVRAGWNMIASPVDREAGSDSVLQIFPSALLPYAFSFSPAGGYLQERVLRPGAGYWEKFGTAGTTYAAGTLRTLDTVAVQAGWNMIGTVSVPVDTSAVVALPAGLRASDWYEFTGSYTASSRLLPGHAYWVKAAAAGSFVLSGVPRVRGVSPESRSRGIR